MRGRGRDGIALISGLIFLAITVVLVSVALMVSISNRRLSGDYLRTTGAQIAADAGLERAIYEVWFKPNLEAGDLPADFQLTLEQFRASLDEAGILAGSAPSGTSFNFGPAVSFQDRFENTSYTTSLRRVDVGDKYTLLRLDSVGKLAELATRRVTEDLVIGVPQHDASQFALLSNQANCVFCHTQITSLEVGYTSDGALAQMENLTAQQRATVFKNKTRIRVGVLEQLQSDRISEMESLIAGTLYSRGETNVFSSNSSLYSVPFSTIDGHTISRLSADELQVLSSAANCGSGCRERLQRAYRNYPVQGPDGELPEVFPSLIEDNNGNRVIEHSEWQAAISAEDSLGKLKGGNKKRVNTTTSGTATLTAERATGLQNATLLSSLESNDGVKGNLVLEGTSSNPLVIEDTLYVNGDVMIQGPITGDGKIVARGNIYISGNITYACDNDSKDATYAVANKIPCNYAQPDTLPRLALVAGKTILLGNYMMPGFSAPSRPNDHLTREDVSSVSPEELAQWFVDAGQAFTPNAALSYSMIQAALFNQTEYDKARGDSNYIPRFYRMRDDSPVWLCKDGFGQNKNDFCKSYSDLTNLSVSTLSQDEAILSRASLLSLTPSDSWLASLDDIHPSQSSELAVRKAWVNAVETNNTQDALRIDGVLFSNNAFFGLLPTSSKTSGKALLNGSLVVADTAFLPTQGLRLHYDERLSELIDPSTVHTVVQTRSNYRLLKVGEQVTYSAVGY